MPNLEKKIKNDRGLKGHGKAMGKFSLPKTNFLALRHLLAVNYAIFFLIKKWNVLFLKKRVLHL